MKTEGRKALHKLVGLVASFATLFLVAGTTAAATSLDSIEGLQAGAAEILDAAETVETEELTTEELTDGSSTNDEVDEGTEEADDTNVDEESTLVMANVEKSMNVREEPSTESSKVGLLYADCGGTILERANGWTKLQSGNLIGWASDEYLLFGEEAEQAAEEVGVNVATVNADGLRVRKEPDTEAGVWGTVKNGDTYEAVKDETTGDWVAIEYGGELGYISAEYVEMEFTVDHGETYDEIKEREKREKKERAKLIATEGASILGTTDDVLLGALIQCESGNQPYEGQVAVGAVVMNRVNSGAYPNTIAGVIYASGQFTPAGNGAVEKQISKGVKESCLQAAQAAMNGETTVGGAMHFRRVGVHEGIEIGGHVFW